MSAINRPNEVRRYRRNPASGVSARASRSSSGRRPVKANYSAPPVLVRNDSPAPATQPRKVGRNRRRYDVALSVPGAEVRLPAIPVFHWSWRWISGVMTLALAGLLYYLWTAPTFRVVAPQVSGLQRITQADIDTVVGVSDTSIFSINPAQIQADLQQAFPETSAITVEMRLPAQLLVMVAERTPVLSWTQDGKEMWIDADGYLFPPRGDNPGLVTVQGALPTETSPDGKIPMRLYDPQMVLAIEAMSAQAPKKATLIYDPEHGLGWKDKKGWYVYFGMDAANMNVKLQEYQTLLKRLSSEGLSPSLISLEYIDAPYFKVQRSEN